MCLSIYAYKCGVPKKQLRQDMRQAFEDLQKVKHENVLTEDDIRSALEAYDKGYYNFTIADIEALTDVRIEKNKRNGRKQEQHEKIMNAIRDIEHPNGSWRNISGRPSVRDRFLDGGNSARKVGKRTVIETPGLIRKQSINGGIISRQQRILRTGIFL